MSFLIDTDVAIHIRDGTPSILRRFEEQEGVMCLSALSLAELQRGLYRDSTVTTRRRLGTELLLRSLPVLPFDGSAAIAYGRIIEQRGWARNRDYDRMIAAHAISTGSILVTCNTADFHDTPELRFERWRITGAPGERQG